MRIIFFFCIQQQNGLLSPKMSENLRINLDASFSLVGLIPGEFSIKAPPSKAKES